MLLISSLNFEGLGFIIIKLVSPVNRTGLDR